MTTVSGTNAPDTIFGSAAADSLSGLDNEDFLSGLADNDTLLGGAGDDFLKGGSGDDLLDGGTGEDMADYSSAGSGVTVDLTLSGGQNTGEGSDTLISIENIFGSSFADILTGDGSANYLHGYDGGSDLLDGMGGNDILEVQRFSSSPAAAITMLGGAGSDTLRYIGIGAADSATLNAGSNSDTIESTGLLNGTIIANGGNDRVSIDTLIGQYSISLGAGGDTLVLQSTGGGFRAANAITLSDFTTGNGADKVDLSAWLSGGALTGYGGGNPFLSGYLRLVQSGPDTLLAVDQDGGGNGFVTLLTFLSTTATAFTAANFSGFLPVVEGEAAPDTSTGTSDPDTITGSEVADVISGLAGADELDGAGGNDTLSGGTEDDALLGGEGADSLAGDAGFDYLSGGNGHDTLRGGDDDDVLLGGAGDDLLDGGIGQDMADYSGASSGVTVNLGNGGAQNTGDGSDTLTAIEDVFGSSFNDLLTGDANANFLYAGDGGNDRLVGNGGDDYLDAQRLFSAAAAITLQGGTGNDTLIYYGYEAADQATLDGGADADTITAIGLANGVIDAAGGIDAVSIDTLTGSYVITLGAGGDTLTLQSTEGGFRAANAITVTDFVTGNSNDILDLSAWIAGGALQGYTSGSPVMSGHVQLVQSGGDTLFQVDRDGGADAFTTLITFQNTTATSFNSQNLGGLDLGFMLTGTGGPDTLTGSAFADWLSGLGGNDSLIGSGGDDTLLGGDNSDTLNAGDGNDLLDGGAGTDSMVGGLGDDSYIVDATSDIAVEGASAGTDSVNASASFTLGANIETLTLTGTADIDGTGNVMDNVITGNSGNNSLSGGTGADTLAGGAGNDIYVVDNAGDVVVEDVDSGTDTVNASVTYAIATNIENLVLTGAGAIHATGNALNNIITGNSGANSLIGGAGSDTLDGGTGTVADTLDGGEGADSMAGGAGNDSYWVDDAGDVTFEAAASGTDIVNASVSYTLGDNVENLTLIAAAIGAISGTGNDVANSIIGNELDNVLSGAVGNDTLTGNDGADTLAGDSGTDSLVGGNGADSLVGGADNDTLSGGNDNDTLTGGTGNDSMLGGLGDDLYEADSATDVVNEAASEGSDTVNASVTFTISDADVENLTLIGTADINATGNASNNVITGNSGNNSLNGAAGADTMAGGAGDDMYTVDNVGDVVTEGVGGGTDTVTSALAFTLGDNVENLTLTATVNGTGNAENNIITGNGGANLLSGLDGADTLIGAVGNDTLLGGEGADSLDGGNSTDSLDGGAGSDMMAGGLGNDTYIVDDAGDMIIEAAAAGTDIVNASVSFTLSADVETLVLTGTALDGTGNDLANGITGNGQNNVLSGGLAVDTLSGGDGADTLIGGAGADSMAGGLGDDVYDVDTTDIVVEAASAGTDTVNASLTYTLGTNVENLTLTGTGNINGTGNVLANVIAGNSGNNLLTGANGNDTLTGGDGNDTLDGGNQNDSMTGGIGDDSYVVNSATDEVVEAASAGTDLVTASVTFTLSANVENLTLSGTAAIHATGNGENNLITGNTGANTLTGGDGNDTLNGGTGNDTMVGGIGDDFYFVDAAADVVTEAASAGIDSVSSSVAHTLSANVENLTLTGANINGTGNAENNQITGSTGNNSLSGGNGNDTLDGGLGTDTLNGGNNNDVFQFSTALAGNIDSVVSFDTSLDSFRLDDAIFTTVGAVGTLSSNAFVVGAAATTAAHRIILNGTALLYDSDGTGAAAAVQFATLTTPVNNPTFDDFVIY